MLGSVRSRPRFRRPAPHGESTDLMAGREPGQCWWVSRYPVTVGYFGPKLSTFHTSRIIIKNLSGPRSHTHTTLQLLDKIIPTALHQGYKAINVHLNLAQNFSSISSLLPYSIAPNGFTIFSWTALQELVQTRRKTFNAVMFSGARDAKACEKAI
jgi:hypothetical protein